MEKQTKKWVISGSVLSVIAGSIFVASNKKTREGVTDFVSTASSQTKHWFQVINENRDTVVQQLRSSGDKISAIVDSASDDVEKLVETSKSLKAHVFDLLEAVQDSTEEIKGLKSKFEERETIEAETTMDPDPEALLPPDTGQKKLEE
ncbi:hypothetical protein [Salipaludibacillus aurantiacus]|uniref:Gas vesicle protein n=1 Tax=Salipaludibacillus aurantiacus TaxID=1601833 RepID=A0A1H9SKP0_9BACI|nr:hypothetical protein [Salipaludibacillus aurantiacus]SER84913.1 hypothetical protein SAMN05518684_104247 [Salipaludibacillus aurantiacus]